MKGVKSPDGLRQELYPVMVLVYIYIYIILHATLQWRSLRVASWASWLYHNVRCVDRLVKGLSLWRCVFSPWQGREMFHQPLWWCQWLCTPPGASKKNHKVDLQRCVSGGVTETTLVFSGIRMLHVSLHTNPNTSIYTTSWEMIVVEQKKSRQPKSCAGFAGYSCLLTTLSMFMESSCVTPLFWENLEAQTPPPDNSSSMQLCTLPKNHSNTWPRRPRISAGHESFAACQ